MLRLLVFYSRLLVKAFSFSLLTIRCCASRISIIRRLRKKTNGVPGFFIHHSTRDELVISHRYNRYFIQLSTQ